MTVSAIPVEALRPPATLGIFTPSSPLNEKRLEQLETSRVSAAAYGFDLHAATHTFAQDAYMAGSPLQRCADIHALAQNDDIHALLASHGGKSCNQLLPYLDYDLLAQAAKPIIGFSDGGVLLNAITARTGLVTFYGGCAVMLMRWQHANLALLRDNSAFEQQTNLLGQIQAVQTQVLRPGIASGQLVGGDLTTFVLGVAATAYLPVFDDLIFFCESPSIQTQILDQYLTSLRNRSFFDRVRGMVIGDIVRDESVAYKNRDPIRTVLEVLADYNFPIVVCPTFGHRHGLENPLLPIGARCRLNADAVTLQLEEPIIDCSRS